MRTAEKESVDLSLKGGNHYAPALARVLFRRRMLTILLLLLQVYFLICLVLGGSQLSRNFSRLLTIVSIIAVLYIVSQKDKGAYKTAWAILILTFPLFGGLMYLLSKHNPRNGALQKVSSIHNKRQNHSMHSPAFAMKAQQNNCLNITLKFITCRNTRVSNICRYRNITLHRVNESWKHFLAELEKAEKYIFWNISSCRKALCGTASWKF